MIYDAERALALLRQGTGKRDAEFRDGQEEAIRTAVAAGSRTLVVQKTGWGKSYVYFIASRLIREWGLRNNDQPGPVLLISPLLGLMRDQIRNAQRTGIKALTVCSDNFSDWNSIAQSVTEHNTCDILLITPERLGNSWFNENILSVIAGRIPMLVVDEVHCMSDWGHDFRPDYRRIENLVKRLPPNTRLLATTATANERVKQDLRKYLGGGLKEFKGSLGRSTLLLQTIRLPRHAERLAWLADRLEEIAGSGIIYASTRKDVKRVTYWLQQCGYAVEAYSGETDREYPGLRTRLEQDLLENRLKAVVATIALGIGFDKPDLAFVIHYQRPGSVVAYYQQVGRAGRGVPKAHAVLLCGVEDTRITDFFIRYGFPSRDHVDRIMHVLSTSSQSRRPWEQFSDTESQPAGMPLWELARKTGIRQNHLGNWMKILATEEPAPVVCASKAGTGSIGGSESRRIRMQQGQDVWVATGEPVAESFWKRAARVVAQRRAELAEMEEYIRLESGHMEFLIEALDGEPEPCERPDLAMLSTEVGYESRRRAAVFVKQWDASLLPRIRWIWPDHEFIPHSRRSEAGMWLCALYGNGPGAAVQDGFRAAAYAGELVRDAAVKLRRSGLAEQVAWVTCVPSPVEQETARLEDFAGRLAQRLSLPFARSLAYAWNRDYAKRLRKHEMHIQFLAIAPGNASEVLWAAPVRDKLKYDSAILHKADRVVVYCPAEAENSALHQLREISNRHGWPGQMTVWRFNGPGQSGNSAVMLFPGKSPWRMRLNSLGQSICYGDGLHAIARNVSRSPALLVDDLVDYRWSFAYAADRLREAGCLQVYPFALAKA